MATQARQGQHKPERDGAKGRELTAAKQEIKQLKRQVSRLQKTIRKLEEQRGIDITIEEESPPQSSRGESKPVVLDGQDKCADCGSTELVKFKIPGKSVVLTVCKTCKHKSRFAIEEP